MGRMARPAVPLLLVALSCARPEALEVDPSIQTSIWITEVANRAPRAELQRHGVARTPESLPLGTKITAVHFQEAAELLGIAPPLAISDSIAASGDSLPLERAHAVVGGTLGPDGLVPDHPDVVTDRARRVRYSPAPSDCSLLEQAPLVRIVVSPGQQGRVQQMNLIASLSPTKLLVTIDSGRFYSIDVATRTVESFKALEDAGVLAKDAWTDATGRLWLGGQGNALWSYDPSRSEPVGLEVAGTSTTGAIERLAGAPDASEIWAMGSEEGQLRSSYALQWRRGARTWTRYDLRRSLSPSSTVDLAWIGPGRVLAASDAPPLLEFSDGRLSEQQVGGYPGTTVTAVFYASGTYYAGTSGSRRLLWSRTDAESSWTVVSQSASERLVRIGSTVAGIAGVGTGGRVELAVASSRPQPELCGRRVQEGRLRTMHPTARHLWFGGREDEDGVVLYGIELVPEG